MRKIQLLPLLCFLLLTGLPYQSHSQENDKKKTHEFLHRLSVGGNFGFQFGSVTSISVSPEIQIRVVDQFHLGTGFTYQFLKYDNSFYNLNTERWLDLKINVYGGRIFARYYFSNIFNSGALKNIFAHAEYEYLTYHIPYKPSDSINGFIIDYHYNFYEKGNHVLEINSLFVGGGYRQPIVKRVFFDLLILVNLNDTYDSPYSNPVIRLGVGTGL